MRIKKKGVILSCIVFVVVTAFVFTFCGGGSSSSSFDFFATAEKATPIVTPAVTSSVSATATWSMGNTLYEIFQLIREYRNDRDNGVIDGSNMHKALYDASSYVTGAIQGCLTTANDGTVVADHSINDQSITSPFDFGSDTFTQTYNCAYTTNDTSTMQGATINYTKSFAVKYAAGIYYMLMGWYSTTGTTTSPAVTQLEYDTATNAIKINNAYFVDYGTGGTMTGTYNVRIYVNGNTATHLFSLKLFKYNPTGASPSIAGYGYSEGAGKYYLFKVDTQGSASKYFCFPANATEADLEAMSDAGETTVPTNCTGMDTGLPTNYNTDGSDSATSATKFTGAGTSGIELTWTH